jgi:hypothetical protein
MFENPDFQVDEESEEFRLLNPLVSRISEKRKKQLRLLEQQELKDVRLSCAQSAAGGCCCLFACFKDLLFCGIHGPVLHKDTLTQSTVSPSPFSSC